jgi:hypothetical protein
MILVALGAMLAVSCGGGGGGGNSYEGRVYKGKTTAATINDGTEAVLRSAGAVGASMDQGDVIAGLISTLGGARAVMPRVTTDSCGGSVDETETGNPDTGSYTATFDTFHPTCATPTTYLDGGLKVSWSSPVGYTHNAVTLDQFGYTTSGFKYLFDGNFVWDQYPDHDRFAATFEGALDGETFKADNFEVLVDSHLYRMSGRYYLAAYGYLDYATTSDFVWTGCEGGPAPASGVLEVTAAGGDVWTLDFGAPGCDVVHVTGPGYDDSLTWPSGGSVVL